MPNKAKQKVLILIGDVGGGHHAPATAMKHVFDEKYADEFEVKILDLFTEADVAPYNTSDSSYALFSQNYTLEKINNFLFRLFSTRIGHYVFAKYTNSRLYRPTLEIITRENPDIVITNNPIVCVVTEAIRRKVGGFYSVTQVTDLATLMRGWADKSADLVISPAEGATKQLIKFGVQKERIVGELFPIRPGLQKARPRDEVLKELGFSKDKFTIMVTGGGVGTNKHLLKSIDTVVDDQYLQVVIMAGKTEKVKKLLERHYQGHGNVKILGFTKSIQDYYSAADIVVAKPGTSTTLEMELFGKRTILTRKVGEQEIGNVEYALQNPYVRYMGDHWFKLRAYVRELLSVKTKPMSRRSFDEAEKLVDEVVKHFEHQVLASKQ